ncbi:MAG TPA: SMC-Scp complex subunit ScpB [Longimicrobiales bacterium]|nr:SMC-Scp complex subunit ScpB [Longimicrobiales bacterium]
MRLTQIIEALLFASDAPLTAADLARVDERLDEDTVQAVIDELRSEYDQTERSFQIADVAGGYQLLTRPEFVIVLERYETVPQPSRLSTPALEVLSIIAYRQPIGRAEVEDIRGVSSSGVLKTLQDRNLIDVVGRAEGLGRPLLYGTTPKFMEHFGFRSLEDLPRPDELPVVLRERPFGPEPAAEGISIPEGEPGHVEAPPPVSEEELDHEAELIVEASGEEPVPPALVSVAAAAPAEAEESAAMAAEEAGAMPGALLEEFEAPAARAPEQLEERYEIEPAAEERPDG